MKTGKLFSCAILLALTLFSCNQEIIEIISNEVDPTAAGKVRDIKVAERSITSFVLQWNAPTKTGVREDGTTPLTSEEIVYRIYYLAVSAEQELLDVESVRQAAIDATPSQEQTITGGTRTSIVGLEENTRYFVVIESYNPFTKVSNPLDNVLEIDIIPPIPDITGTLSYEEQQLTFYIHDEPRTLTPVQILVASEAEVRYKLDKNEGDGFVPDTAVSIDEGTGVITINPETTNTGTTSYLVSAIAEDHNTQYVAMTISILPQPTGPVRDIVVDASTIESTSFLVSWEAPTMIGSRDDGTPLGLDEIVYRVYYLVGDPGDPTLDAETIRQRALESTPPQVREVTGVTGRILASLEASTHYFVVVESQNPFVETGVLSEQIIMEETAAPLQDFDGNLEYGADITLDNTLDNTLDITLDITLYINGDTSTFEPMGVPSTSGTPGSGAQIRYRLEKVDGTDFELPPGTSGTAVSIGEGTGVITINPAVTNTGVVEYLLRVEANGYNTKDVEVRISISPIPTGSVSGVGTLPGSVRPTRFGVMWTPPAETGTDSEGTVLDSSDIRFRIYYFAVSSSTLSHVLVKENAEAAGQVLRDVTGSDITIIDLIPDTRYLYVVESYNTFSDMGGTLSEEVGETRTSKRSFNGRLSYAETAVSLYINDIIQTFSPSNVLSTENGALIRYSLERTSASGFDPSTAVSIDGGTGIITISPAVMNTMTVEYSVSVDADQYKKESVDFSVSISPQPTGSVRDIVVDEIKDTSFLVSWTVPNEKGTKEDGTVLELNELVYSVYYLAVGADDEDPSAETIRQRALESTPPQVQEVTEGDTSVRIMNVTAGTRYFVTVDTSNTSTQVGTLNSVVNSLTTLKAFQGNLTYADTAYEYTVHDGFATISAVPSLPTTANGETISYSIERVSGNPIPESVVTIDEDSAEITINPTYAGSAEYVVRTEATAFQTQELTLMITIHPRVAGPVTGLSIVSDSQESSSFAISWTAPGEKGTREDGTRLTADELRYVVYYVSSDQVLQTNPSAEEIRESTITASDADDISRTQEVVGLERTRIFGLSAGTSYFVVVETYNTFTETRTLSENIVNPSTANAAMSSFTGSLGYGATEFSFLAGDSEATKNPTSRPNSASGEPISYVLEKRDGVDFDPSTAVRIDRTSGALTIDPSTMNVGTARYWVSVTATNHNAQFVDITVHINLGVDIRVYHDDSGTRDPVFLGQSIHDEVLSDMDAILMLSESRLEGNYTIHFGSAVNNYSESYQKTASNGTIELLKSELMNNSFSFIDGAVVGLSGSGIVDIQHLATYKPSEIHGWQDLQAMRSNLDGDYILKQDIVFPSRIAGISISISNFEAVGTVDEPFTGSIDGSTNGVNRFSITGLQIEGTDTDNYQGLFGVMEAENTDTVIASNIILMDFIVVGGTHVGSLAGSIKKGMIEKLNVERSDADSGRVKGIDNVGGLVGSNSSTTQGESIVMVSVVGRNNVGGLVGTNENGGSVLGRATETVMGSGNSIGGLIGTNSGTVRGFSLGAVTGDGNSIGGLVGENSGSVLSTSYATGAVTGRGDFVGGLVGKNSGPISESYATGAVSSRGDDVGGLVGANLNNSVITGYATGPVTGFYYVGGLVGRNSGTVGKSSGVTIASYATGSVDGRDDYIGGLIGWNNGIVVGHATGVVTGDASVGGLVGRNEGSGDVVGYARGAVTGAYSVGGLVGTNSDTASVIGYATGMTIGGEYYVAEGVVHYVGGLVGRNEENGAVVGYSRGIVRRSRGGTTAGYGKTIGSTGSRSTTTFHSAATDESKLYDGVTGERELVGAMGQEGMEVNITEVNQTNHQTMFSGFQFGGTDGEWIWVADGKWPAINIDASLLSNQPLD